MDKQVLLLEMARSVLSLHHAERLETAEEFPYVEGCDLYNHTRYILGRLREETYDK